MLHRLVHADLACIGTTPYRGLQHPAPAKDLFSLIRQIRKSAIFSENGLWQIILQWWLTFTCTEPASSIQNHNHVVLVSSRFCCKMRMLDLSDVPVLVYNMYMCYCTTCMYCQCYCTVENVGHSLGCILQDWCPRSAALAEIASIVLVAELRQLSEQHVLILMIQTRHLSLFGHIIQIDDNVDEKMLTTSPVEEWKRPPGVISSGYMDEDSPRWR